LGEEKYNAPDEMQKKFTAIYQSNRRTASSLENGIDLRPKE
jgi:hypothetical protein